jgi:putative sporulation protein YtaF
MFEGLAGLLLLAVAVSVDGFGAGLGYGLRRTRLDGRNMALIGLVAGATVLVTTAAGHLLCHQVGALARQLGAALLLALALVSLGNGLRERGAGEESGGPGEAGDAPSGGRNTLWSLQLRTWGLVVEVARQPGRADLDRSGSISLPEALILGLALSLDSGAVGFGAGLAGFSPWAVAAAVGPVNVALLWLGTWAGRRLARERARGWLALSPGFILLILGLMRLLP